MIPESNLYLRTAFRKYIVLTLIKDPMLCQLCDLGYFKPSAHRFQNCCFTLLLFIEYTVIMMLMVMLIEKLIDRCCYNQIN